MKKLKKNWINLFAIAVTAIICITGTAYATYKYSATEIEYKDGKSIEMALNELYKIKDSKDCQQGSYKHIGNSKTEYEISLDFVPTEIVVYEYVKEQDFVHILFYNKNYSDKILGTGYYFNGNGEKAFDASKYFSIKGSYMTITHPSGTYVSMYDTDVYWIAAR